MSKRKKRSNGREVIDKMIPLLIPGGPQDPNYRANYKRLRRHREKIGRVEPERMSRLERDADRLLKDLGLTLGRKRVLKR